MVGNMQESCEVRVYDLCDFFRLVISLVNRTNELEVQAENSFSEYERKLSSLAIQKENERSPYVYIRSSRNKTYFLKNPSKFETRVETDNKNMDVVYIENNGKQYIKTSTSMFLYDFKTKNPTYKKYETMKNICEGLDQVLVDKLNNFITESQCNTCNNTMNINTINEKIGTDNMKKLYKLSKYSNSLIREKGKNNDEIDTAKVEVFNTLNEFIPITGLKLINWFINLFAGSKTKTIKTVEGIASHNNMIKQICKTRVHIP